MSDSNRVRLTWVDDVIGTLLGTTPPTPRMRESRYTSEGLRYTPTFVQSETLRADRMEDDPIKVSEENTGPISGELSYPVDLSPESSWFQSMMCNVWSNTAFRDNDGTADSVITDVGAGGVVAVTSPVGSAAFVAGQLVRFSGFTNAANNGVFRCTAGSATVPAFVGAGLVAEPAPPAAARMKVVGAQGVAADITSTATGLTSTALDWTTLGLVVGQWIKVGSLNDATQFAYLVTAGAAARKAAWGRITAITATALTLDNLPPTWAVDAGAGKTITIYFGDQIKNGVLRLGGTAERGFMDHTPPSYISQRGLVVGSSEFNFPNKDKATWTHTFTGMNGSASTVTLDATPDASTTTQVFAPGVNASRIAENGVCIASPNFAQSLQITINNNLRMIDGLSCGDAVGPLDMGLGSVAITVNMPTYFGNLDLLNKLFNGTATNINTRLDKNNQALIFALPRVTYTEGSPNSGGKNQDVIVPLQGMASKDTLTNAEIIIDRLEWVE